ncbi:type II toxin-antitoxin system HigB family toxin [Lutibaculum baratangense]|uniref:type II toxin-antitoxin system HigB family toxin n=1 Tax=Lutibaculum baratangense TaxID=1358440 RepID=UPI00058E788E|nr:type II toxin-antitoxin system HigB family toxin [Lutibaculum baratangense]
MQIVAKRTLKLFWERHHRAEGPLRAWHSVVERAEWSSPRDIKDLFGTTVDFVADNRVVFDIGGNKYRLVVHVSYEFKRVLIKFIGTHRDYDRIDAARIR